VIPRLGLLVLAAALAAPPMPAAGQAAPLTVSVRGVEPRVSVGQVLLDPALEESLRSGLPLRMRFRTELWRDRFFDSLIGEVTWSVVIAFEPLEGVYLVGRPETDSLESHTSFARARASVERTYSPAVRPRGPGRYYYLATLEIETLSLSDLEELGRWLSGELAPAVGEQGSVAGAVGTGLRRFLIRVLDLPARRYQDRTERFEVR
jgi:hypothetical protein